MEIYPIQYLGEEEERRGEDFPAEYGGIRRGESLVGASGSGMARMRPCRRVWKKEVGR